MDVIAGKVAFVTGGASGIGLGIARALIGAGAKVVIADVRRDALAAAVKSLGDQARGFELDVTDRAAWSRAADEAERAFGKVHILCSNAGVNIVGPTQEATFQDWEFCLGVNLGGAVNAVKTFTPRMLAHGEGGHIVITSSVSGIFTGRGQGVYATTKYALVGLGESLRADLQDHGIGVSLLCPGPVQSDLFESTVEVRPAGLAETGSVSITAPGVSREDTPIFATAMTGDQTGLRVLAGIRRNDLYIMTHAETGPVIEARFKAQLAALPDETVDPARIAGSAGLLDETLYREQSKKPRPSAADWASV